LLLSDVVARIGGDGFLILLPYLRYPDDARQAAQHVLDCSALPLLPSLGAVKVGAGMGIAILPHDGNQSTELVQAADAAMCRNPASGLFSYN
jgi:GGDEF domain-containing protein